MGYRPEKHFFGEVFGANSGNLQMSVIIDKILTVSSNKRKIPIRNKIVSIFTLLCRNRGKSQIIAGHSYKFRNFHAISRTLEIFANISKKRLVGICRYVA